MNKKTNGASKQTFSRRQFLKRTSSAAAGAVAFPHIIPASALGAGRHVAPSNRIVMGCIGLGGQGTGNMRSFLGFREVQVVAVCDVDTNHRKRAQDIVNERYDSKDCAGYNDFRDLLARGDLDALSIALPDHWHAIPAIAGARLGLDIYAEKPLARTIPQGRAMIDAVDRYGIVWQVGCQQRSGSNFRHACELVRNGRIGTVSLVEVGLPAGSPCEPQPEMPIPEGFDYDMWLGPAPWAPYTKRRCHWDFRWIKDYSGGQMTDWAGHHIDIGNWGMGTDLTGPAEIEGTGVFPRDGLFDALIAYDFTCKFPAGASPVAPDGFTMHVSSALPSGTKFIGTDGWIHVNRGYLETGPVSLKDSLIGPNEIRLHESRDHKGDFLNAVRTRGATVAPIETGQRAISVAHIGTIAIELGRKVRWNPDTEQFIDDAEANRRQTWAMRGDWHI